MTLMLFGDEVTGCMSKENDCILKYEEFKNSLCWEENRDCQWCSHNVNLITCWSADSQMSSFVTECIDKLRFHAFL